MVDDRQDNLPLTESGPAPGGSFGCPYLRLRGDEHTSAAYPRVDHRCLLLGDETLEAEWQENYCLSAGHVNCPYYAKRARQQREGTTDPGLSERIFNWQMGIVVAVAMVLIVAAGTAFVLQDRGLIGAADDDDDGVEVVDAEPTTDAAAATPTPAIAADETPEATAEPEPDETPAADPTSTPTDDDSPIDGVPAIQTGADFGDPAFEQLWARTESPMLEFGPTRVWVWGEEPITPAFEEPWEDSADGVRLVQYFEFGRMELDDGAVTGDAGEVTLGVLTRELVGGYYQTGLTEFDRTPGPAETTIAGDLDTLGSPTYADIATLGLMERDPTVDIGDVITETIDGGQVTTDQEFAAYSVTAAYEETRTNHMIASIFWDYLNEEDAIFEDGEFTIGPLFETPFQVIGLPVTDAFWATVELQGTEQDILWQCFERRCLIYLPENEVGLQVESNSIGRHYYQWRYGGS